MHHPVLDAPVSPLRQRLIDDAAFLSETQRVAEIDRPKLGALPDQPMCLPA
ncbi:hypothetical protein NKI38_29960 [Mesorhizobium sp. M0621]|uniref:hypothetical protein n=1 Tax=Mesorhizobium sp. M0621 TaxID=2956974 RepID=UPI0033391FFE